MSAAWCNIIAMAKTQTWIEFQAKLKANSQMMQEAEAKLHPRHTDNNPPWKKKRLINSPYYMSQAAAAQMRVELFDKIMADNTDPTPLADETMENVPNPTPQETIRNVEELVGAVRVVSKKDPIIFESSKKRHFNYGLTLMRIVSGEFVPYGLDNRSKDVLNMDLHRSVPEIETDAEI